MQDAVRVILVDPGARSREALKRQLEDLGNVDLVEACAAYPSAFRAVAAVAPDLAVVVMDEDMEAAVGLIESLSSCHPEVALLPAGDRTDSTAILRAVRAGAREFLPLPPARDELADAVRRLCPRVEADVPEGPRGAHVIAVTGASGGVGCTSVSVNLAAALAKLSRRDTVLADFDLLLGSLEECLGVDASHSLEGVIRDLGALDTTTIKRVLPRHSCGLYVVPHPVCMEEAARIDPSALRRVLGLLKDAFPTVVIDTSKGLQPTDILAFEVADVILVVLQLNLYCTRNTHRLLDYLRQFDGFAEKVRLVVNRVNSPLSEISERKAEEILKMPIAWQVPNATKLFRPARTLGVPIDEVEEGTGSKAHQAVLSMAKALHPFPGQPPAARKRLFSVFR